MILTSQLYMILTSKLKGGVLQAGSTVILNVFWWSFFYPHNLKITQLQKLRNDLSLQYDLNSIQIQFELKWDIKEGSSLEVILSATE